MIPIERPERSPSAPGMAMSLYDIVDMVILILLPPLPTVYYTFLALNLFSSHLITQVISFFLPLHQVYIYITDLAVNKMYLRHQS